MNIRKRKKNEKEQPEENMRTNEESLKNRPNKMNWKEMVESATSPEAFIFILECMFENNVYSEGKMQVLSFYTTDVCNLYPEIATAIHHIYLAFVEAEKMKQRQYCIIL